MGGPRNATVLTPLVRFSEVRKGDKGVSDCSKAKKDLGKLMGIRLRRLTLSHAGL